MIERLAEKAGTRRRPCLFRRSDEQHFDERLADDGTAVELERARGMTARVELDAAAVIVERRDEAGLVDEDPRRARLVGPGGCRDGGGDQDRDGEGSHRFHGVLHPYCTFSAKSSTTNDVCSCESSVPTR